MNSPHPLAERYVNLSVHTALHKPPALKRRHFIRNGYLPLEKGSSPLLEVDRPKDHICVRPSATGRFHSPLSTTTNVSAPVPQYLHGAGSPVPVSSPVISPAALMPPAV